MKDNLSAFINTDAPSKENLIPSIKDALWYTVTPDVGSGASFPRTSDSGSLNIELSSDSYGVGKWVCEFPLSGDETFRLRGACITECDETDAYFIFALLDGEGKMITRDHVDRCRRQGDRLVYEEDFYAPKETASIRLELWLKGNYARAAWLQPTLTMAPPIGERLVRVSIAYIAPDSGELRPPEENMKVILRSIDESAKFSPDLIVLSEGMDSRCTGIPLKDHAEDIESGRFCSMVRAKAKEYGSYIVYNFHEVENGSYYNTSALFGRNGELCGKYRKTHLTVTELEKGLVPGDSYPVFETDFGKLGMLICWDHYFAEPAEMIAKNGAEIVAVSSAGDANFKGVARAMDGGIWYAIAGWDTNNSYGWGPGRIIAPDGEIVAHTSRTYEPANYVIDLNESRRIHWLSMGDAMSSLRPVYRYQKHSIKKDKEFL